ncbi:MAG: hypothetical protein R2701_07000 [Acidimicrobiales bacterium]
MAGLASGAVDYVTKPFRLAELQARIAAHLRQASAASERGPITGVVEVRDLTIDVPARRVSVAGRPVELRPQG